MIDTHAHLNFPELANELDEVLSRASLAGVSRMIVPATTVDTSESSLELARLYPGVLYGCAGIHPCHAHEISLADQQRFAAAVEWGAVTAVGEVGFDTYHLPGDAEKADKLLGAQRLSFEFWVQQAVQQNKPLIIHSREAFDLSAGVLGELAYEHPTVIHCFTGSFDEAASWLELGYHLSLTGVLTYKKSAALRDVVAQLPLDRIMLETDAPFLSPEGKRSLRCEPAFVRDVAECLADLHGKTVEEIDAITSETAANFFNLR